MGHCVLDIKENDLDKIVANTSQIAFKFFVQDFKSKFGSTKLTSIRSLDSAPVLESTDVRREGERSLGLL